MKSKKKRLMYCFDIDGVICTNTEGEYQAAKPIPQAIKKVNSLYKEGHKIILYTARGSVTGIDWKDFTIKQLNLWKVSYHELIMGKPTADIYVDDKSTSVRDWLKK